MIGPSLVTDTGELPSHCGYQMISRRYDTATIKVQIIVTVCRKTDLATYLVLRNAQF